MAAPPLLVSAGASVVLVAALSGFHPLWSEDDVTIAEAAALRNVAALVIRIEAGENPTERTPVRPGLLAERGMTLTPLEAAVAAGRLDVMQVLLRRGATLEEHDRQALICFAADEGEQQIVEFLRAGSGHPTSLEKDCEALKGPG